MTAQSEARDGAWIAVQVRPGAERAVSRSLRTRGYVDFLPLYKPQQLWNIPSDTSVVPEKVLFPGYVFCRFIQAPAFRIVEIPGVVRLVGFNRKVAAIPDEEIDAISKVIASNTPRKPAPFFQQGEPVEVVNGPLAGVTGTLLRQKGSEWVVICVPLLKNAIAAEINLRDVRPLAADPVERALSRQRTRA